MNNKLIKKHPLKTTWTLLFACILAMFSCGENDDNEKGKSEYDPGKPVELTTFYPDSGRYLEQVMLEGKNFGTDPEKIRVYFNSKKAAVIGSTGSRMYVLAPRLPGDTCVISVAIGNDSVAYDQTFRYFSSVTVNTIAGNGNQDDYQDGDLTQSILQPRYICVDNEDNIFITTRGPYEFGGTNGHMHIVRIDEENNELITIARDVTANIPAVDLETGIITILTETTVGSFFTLDPKEMWAPRFREMKWPPAGDRPTEGYKHSVVVNPSDGFVYTRYYHGHIVKMNPRTYEVETIFKTEQGDSYGLTFNPLEPNILYISFWGNSGVNANSICSIDITDPENTFKKLSGSTSGGHRDGALEVAQFRNPSQIYSDADGNIYVADCSNHCIRRITPEKMVETVLGMPGTAGWKDGGKEEALFNLPRGLGISKDGSIYVADLGNARVRKLSIN
ncbi:IPT/TIG domain-containing protein [Proteiniphilum acetatigenes]|uniref:IPT/TIG domain-containing protein n=1 Tax=Proteiniphilum acetatigenes TaxID=294710 RepID=UPI0003642205|nr:IPT/TIG domain-containing protein [Proteiniphilum acetatigenes]SFK90037.1 NHL repeat-containing protein [Porphyromonadaceae bacterium KH3CP3RA]